MLILRVKAGKFHALVVVIVVIALEDSMPVVLDHSMLGFESNFLAVLEPPNDSKRIIVILAG